MPPSPKNEPQTRSPAPPCKLDQPSLNDCGSSAIVSGTAVSAPMPREARSPQHSALRAPKLLEAMPHITVALPASCTIDEAPRGCGVSASVKLPLPRAPNAPSPQQNDSPLKPSL